MLRAEDNKFLTESDAGTGMGELLRRFWLPVLLSEELPEADGPPKKIVVMGEELLAFRDSRGVVGVIDQYCPHRGANLWLGRNEECGIRCVYHGWKFDTDGRCVDMPTSYPDLNAKDLIRIKSYPVREWGDMIWAYMGPADSVPELPDLEMALVPASHRYVSKKWQDCNWVQALEGSIDTAHFTFAHLSFEKEENEILDIKKHFVNPLVRVATDHMRWIAEDPRPVIKIIPHEAGLTIGGGRLTGSDNIYWRIAQFLMPVHAYAPSAMPGENIFGQSFVPVTDTNCWIYTYAWNPERPITPGRTRRLRPRQWRDLRGRRELRAAAQQIERLSDRPQAAEDQQLHRHQGRLRTGRRGAGQPGPDRRPHPRASRPDRSRHHAFPQTGDGCARALQQGAPPAHLAHQDRYAVRSGACVTSKAKDLPAVMVERFGDATGYVGRPRTAAAE